VAASSVEVMKSGMMVRPGTRDLGDNVLGASLDGTDGSLLLKKSWRVLRFLDGVVGAIVFADISITSGNSSTMVSQSDVCLDQGL